MCAPSVPPIAPAPMMVSFNLLSKEMWFSVRRWP
jgi:hypothetical protein